MSDEDLFAKERDAADSRDREFHIDSELLGLREAHLQEYEDFRKELHEQYERHQAWTKAELRKIKEDLERCGMDGKFSGYSGESVQSKVSEPS